MVKKITIGLTALLSTLSATSHANTFKTPTCVSVPSYNGGFTFGLTGLYIRPSTEQLDYALVFPTTSIIDPSFTNGSYRSVDPDYDWGYRVNIGYLVPCSGNDVSLTYTNYHNREIQELKPAANNIFFGTITPFIFAATTFTTLSADAESRFEYQAFDLDFGQSINVGCRTKVRYLAGLRFADLEHKFDANYRGTLEFDPDLDLEGFIFTTHQKSTFRGVGPRFGIGSEYSLGAGFGVVGQATGALLVGNAKSNFSQRTLVLEGTTTLFDADDAYEYPEENRVVPNLTAKLGLNYNLEFCNCSHTKLSIEAGYQVDHYFNSVDRLAFSGILASDVKKTMDTNFDGPYVGIQVRI